MKLRFGTCRGTYLVDKPEEEVARVVLIDDIARAYDRDLSSFRKFLKRNRIETQFTVDFVSGQRRGCVTPEVAEQIRQLMTPDEIIPFSKDDVEPDPLSY